MSLEIAKRRQLKVVPLGYLHFLGTKTVAEGEIGMYLKLMVEKSIAIVI